MNEENDYFKPDENRDTNYSQGLTVGGSWRTEGKRQTVGIKQEIYTPDNLRLTTPEPDDRGYAGKLGAFYENESLHIGKLFSLRLEAGCTGDCSQAEAAQKFVHNDLDLGTDPQGWSTQYGQEVYTQASLKRFRRLNFFNVIDLIYGTTAEAGSLESYAEGEGMIRIGRNLPLDMAPIERSGGEEPPTFFVFGGTSLRGVAYNTLLEGSFFRDTDDFPTQQLNYVLARLKLGFVWRLEDYALSYQWIRQSSEYNGQGAHSYGSINLSRSF